MKTPAVLIASILLLAASASAADQPKIPDWAWPGTATHAQVPPPADYHQPTRTDEKPIGIFAGQSDIGGAVIPGSSTFDAKTGQYTIHSAGYNIWYTRDEFRYLWVKLSGDVSLAADVSFPNAEGYGDRKAVFVIRQDLDDDSKEILTALHVAGLIHLALRPEKNGNLHEAARIPASPDEKNSGPVRIGIEKHGDVFALYVGKNGEPMHAVGQNAELHFTAPFYVGIGFTSHVPDKSDTTVLSNVVLENAAGKVH